MFSFSYSFSIVQAQNSAWIKHSPDPVTQSPNVVEGIEVDNSENVFVTGWITNNDDNRDYCTIKYDKDGKEVWKSTFDGNDKSVDQPGGISVDGQGNVYVTGFSWTKLNDFDVFTIKYDANGSILWKQSFDLEQSYDQPAGLRVAKDGTVFIIATSMTKDSNTDLVTMRYDPTGVLLWVKSYSQTATSSEKAKSIEVRENGDVFVSGNTSDDNTVSHYCLVKYDKDGNEYWHKVYEDKPGEAEFLSEMKIDPDGNVLLAGTKFNEPSLGLANTDFVIRKIGSDGITLWTRTFDILSSEDYAGGLDLDEDGNPLLAGTTNSQNAGFNLTVLKYDNTNGNLIWSQKYSKQNNENDLATCIKVTGGQVLIGGSRTLTNRERIFTAALYDTTGSLKWYAVLDPSQTNSGGRAIAVRASAPGNNYTIGFTRDQSGAIRFTVIKNIQQLPPSVVTNMENQLPAGFWLAQNYPNPFNPSTTFQYSLNIFCHVRFSVLNVLGIEVDVLVDRYEGEGIHQIHWAGNKLSSGIYFYRLFADQKSLMKKLVIVK